MGQIFNKQNSDEPTTTWSNKPKFDSTVFGGNASIDVTYLSGRSMAQLDADVQLYVWAFKKQVVEKMGLSPLVEVDLLLDGQALPHAGSLASAGLEPGKAYTLVGLIEEHWILDDSKKGNGVELLDDRTVKNNTTGHECAPNKCRVILGKSPLPQGRHHFRIQLVNGDYYYIGVAEEGTNLNTWLGGASHGWSYYLRDNKSGSRLGPGYINFGPRLYRGQTVHFCFDTVAGTLEIAHENEPLKLGQTGLQGKDMFLALGMGPNGVTLKIADAWRES